MTADPTEPTSGKVEGINVFRTSEVMTWGEWQPSFDALQKLNSGHDKRNVFQKLKAYREHSQRLMKRLLEIEAILESFKAENRMLRGDTGSRHHKRWTPQEDEALIELAVGGASQIELATCMNRTPGSVGSRLTYLVGIRKISREVVGRIIGYLDGEPVDGFFEGSLREEHQS